MVEGGAEPEGEAAAGADAGPSGMPMTENEKRFAPLKAKLLKELAANALDFENPPTQKKTAEDPHPMVWVPEVPTEADNNEIKKTTVLKTFVRFFLVRSLEIESEPGPDTTSAGKNRKQRKK